MKPYTPYIYVDANVLLRVLNGEEYAFSVFEPEQTQVVLGRACKIENDVFIENCQKDRVPILKRMGGGGSVVLTQGIVVISLAGKTPVPFNLAEHMNSVNRSIIRVLESFNITNLSIKGTSDIVLRNRKILGSSLYRKKNLVLYQGSLLVKPDMSIFDRYLKHPEKEPAYRKKRKHSCFMTSLHQEGFTIDQSDLIQKLSGMCESGPPWKELASVISTGN
ncbi:MAG: lipoyl protein ligase domain-containing protein [Spirochaetota bacterium]